MEGHSTVEDQRPRNSYHRVCYVFVAQAASACHWNWTAMGDGQRPTEGDSRLRGTRGLTHYPCSRSKNTARERAWCVRSLTPTIHNLPCMTRRSVACTWRQRAVGTHLELTCLRQSSDDADPSVSAKAIQLTPKPYCTCCKGDQLRKAVLKSGRQDSKPRKRLARNLATIATLTLTAPRRNFLLIGLRKQLARYT